MRKSYPDRLNRSKESSYFIENYVNEKTYYLEEAENNNFFEYEWTTSMFVTSMVVVVLNERSWSAFVYLTIIEPTFIWILKNERNFRPMPRATMWITQGKSWNHTICRIQLCSHHSGNINGTEGCSKFPSVLLMKYLSINF